MHVAYNTPLILGLELLDEKRNLIRTKAHIFKGKKIYHTRKGCIPAHRQ